jgi:hypothetical protein
VEDAASTGLIGEASAHAPAAIRLLRRLFGFIGRRLLGFRFELVGAENLPRDAHGRPTGGWIAAGLPHVTWIEPFVMLVLLPPEPRLIWFGDGRVIERSAWRRVVFGRLGGIVPIWPGGGSKAFAAHAAAVDRVISAGALFAIFPERGGPVPAGQARPVAPGVGYFALRSGAPIVPIVFGGTHELFRGRRIRMQVLPSQTPWQLAGLAADGPPPRPGSRAEHAAAAVIAAALQAQTAEPIAAAHRATEPPPGTHKRWLWLTHAFR